MELEEAGITSTQRFYVVNILSVFVVNLVIDVTEWFLVYVGLKQCCVMTSWLFNVYMDGVMLGKGLELLCANGGGFEINQLLFTVDTALVAVW